MPGGGFSGSGAAPSTPVFIFALMIWLLPKPLDRLALKVLDLLMAPE